MGRVLVTGANGFLGRHAAAFLVERGNSVRSTVRPGRRAPGEIFTFQNLGPETNWRDALFGCDAVVHAAGLAHRQATEEAFERINVAAALNLAEQSAAAGVRRFVFISSAGVFGAGGDTPYTDKDGPAPATPYAHSKLRAELALDAVADLDVLVLRLPMIYGRNAPGNFSRLVRLVQTGVPLPLASIRNRRALIHVDDAAEAIGLSLARFRPGTYAVTGPETVSTPQLASGIAGALGRASLLFPFPPPLIEMTARLAGRGAETAALIRSFTLDASRFEEDFVWRPSIGVGEGLRRSLS
jgi:nucleoside-diphosphate-sugar epimerase